MGALPVGSIINQIELRPGQGALHCRSAGASATVIRRGRRVGEKTIAELNRLMIENVDLDDEDLVLVRNNGNRKTLRLLPSCMVVAGQVSNNQHSEHK